jgi:hypothetical protein
MTAVLPPGMTERELDAAVRRITASLPAVLAYHTRDSRGSAPGYPDWTFAGPGGVMFRELKTAGGTLTRAQHAWLDALQESGADADVWRPGDLLSGRIGRELAELAGLAGRIGAA